MSTSELLTYFTAEKQGAIVLAVLGIVSVIFGVYLWRTGSPFKAMMWPLLQAAVLLVFDLFAEHRALVYTRWLAELPDRFS